MNGDPDERAQPDGAPADDEFEAIVAGWRREGRVPSWPTAAPGPAALFESRPSEYGPTEYGPSEYGPSDSRPSELRPPQSGLFDPASGRPLEEEHFVPPEPPPLPPIGPPALVGLALIGAGLLLLVSPGWLGVSEPYGLPLGLIGVAAGLGWLVLRLWPDAPHADDSSHPDDGAVL